MGISTPLFMSSITKFTRIMNLTILKSTFSTVPCGCLIDLSINYKVVLEFWNSVSSSFLAIFNEIRETLVPRSHKSFEKLLLPILQEMEKFPRSLSFGGNLF